MAILGPNTNADTDLLQEKCIVCFGEDAAHVKPLLPIIQEFRESRCYRFWRLPGLTGKYTRLVSYRRNRWRKARTRRSRH